MVFMNLLVIRLDMNIMFSMLISEMDHTGVDGNLHNTFIF